MDTKLPQIHVAMSDKKMTPKEAAKHAALEQALAKGDVLKKRPQRIIRTDLNEKGYYCNPAGKTYFQRGSDLFSVKPTQCILVPANTAKVEERKKLCEEAIARMKDELPALTTAAEVVLVEINKECMTVIAYKDGEGRYHGLDDHPCMVDPSNPDYDKADVLVVADGGIEFIQTGLKKKQRRLAQFKYAVVGVVEYICEETVDVTNCKEILTKEDVQTVRDPLVKRLVKMGNYPRLVEERLASVQADYTKLLSQKTTINKKDVVTVKVNKEAILVAANESFTRNNAKNPCLVTVAAVHVPKGSDVRAKLSAFGPGPLSDNLFPKPYMNLRNDKMFTRAIVDEPLFFKHTNMPAVVLHKPIPRSAPGAPIPVFDSSMLDVKKSFNKIDDFSDVLGADALALSKMAADEIADFVRSNELVRNRHLKRKQSFEEADTILKKLCTNPPKSAQPPPPAVTAKAEEEEEEADDAWQ